ncbi:oleate hydratase, partial [Staphylococcus aureus]|uniref:oleate hydratase n=1 Tax=Staphylococcus aureus TaxID=1280 RepID=UPI001642CCB0
TSTYPHNHTPPPPTHQLPPTSTLSKNLPPQTPQFPNPHNFSQNIPKKTSFLSPTSTTNNKHIIHTIQTISKPHPLPPKTLTPPIITINHSPCQIS